MTPRLTSAWAGPAGDVGTCPHLFYFETDRIRPDTPKVCQPFVPAFSVGGRQKVP